MEFIIDASMLVMEVEEKDVTSDSGAWLGECEQVGLWFDGGRKVANNRKLQRLE